MTGKKKEPSHPTLNCSLKVTLCRILVRNPTKEGEKKKKRKRGEHKLQFRKKVT